MREAYLEKRSMRLLIGPNGAPVRTSVALEPEFWEQLEACAKRAGQSMPAWIADVDKLRRDTHPNQSLASACRVQVLAETMAAGRAR